MIYIASPYSSFDEAVRYKRFLAVRKFTVGLIEAGHVVFSPILYAHGMSVIHKLPTDSYFWERFNTSILRHCEACYVLQLSGWEESIGVTAEIEMSKKLHIPVFYFLSEGQPVG